MLLPSLSIGWEEMIPWGLIVRLGHTSCKRAKTPRSTSCVCFEVRSVTCPGYRLPGLLYEMRRETSKGPVSQRLQKGE